MVRALMANMAQRISAIPRHQGPLLIFGAVVALSLGAASCGTTQPVRASGPNTGPTTSERCTARNLEISIATSTQPGPAGKLLANASMEGDTVAYLLKNSVRERCRLDGYMIPVWINVPGRPEPYRAQSAMARHALTWGSSRHSVAQVSMTEVPPGSSAAFVVFSAGVAGGDTSVLPGAYIAPDGRHLIRAPDTFSGSATGRPLETPIVPGDQVQKDYCLVLNGTPGCIGS